VTVEDDVPVGLPVYEKGSRADHHDILTMMIDKNHQHKGLGSAAFRELLDDLSVLPQCNRITLNLAEGNERAEAFYRGFGFAPTNEWF